MCENRCRLSFAQSCCEYSKCCCLLQLVYPRAFVVAAVRPFGFCILLPFCVLVLSLQLQIHRCPSIRSPGPVSPRDVECEGFDLTYPRIASSSNSSVVTPALDYDVDKKVDESIQSFLMTLSQIGPELLSVSENIAVSVRLCLDYDNGFSPICFNFRAI
jgi:Autophagy-related protein 101